MCKYEIGLSVWPTNSEWPSLSRSVGSRSVRRALIHFQTTAELVTTDDRRVQGLIWAGELDKVTSHRELDLPDGCFLRIPIPSRIHTYGLGLSLYRLARDPLSAVGIAHLPAS